VLLASLFLLSGKRFVTRVHRVNPDYRVRGARVRLGNLKSPRTAGHETKAGLTRVTLYGVLVLETADRDARARIYVPAL
jgi:hypothetical protein